MNWYWKLECLKRYGRVLDGNHKHYCGSATIPIDDTCSAIKSCRCGHPAHEKPEWATEGWAEWKYPDRDITPHLNKPGTLTNFVGQSDDQKSAEMAFNSLPDDDARLDWAIHHARKL